MKCISATYKAKGKWILTELCCLDVKTGFFKFSVLSYIELVRPKKYCYDFLPCKSSDVHLIEGPD